jgi:hypothetical protein
MDKMQNFLNSYKDIYDFSKGRITQELQVLIEYYYSGLKKFDSNNIDLIEEAIEYKEQKERTEKLKATIDAHHLKVVHDILHNLKKHKKLIIS